MPYQCLECGNKSSKKFPGGKCPACDSFRVKTIGKPEKKSVVRQKESKTKVEIFLMVLLWGLLAYGVWDRYLKDLF